MAGDALISESYLQINTAQFSQNIQAQLINRLGRSIFEVIGGELLDVEAAFVNDVVFDPLKIYRYKTASYSFIGPLLSGAICAGADGDTLQMLERFAEKIGVAYQLQDDLLGVFGDEKETGKSTLSDLREGKQTLLINFHKDLMNKEQLGNFKKFGDSHASEEELIAIRVDMQASGAQQKMVNVTDKYFNEIVSILENMPDGVRRQELTYLVQKIKTRKR